MCGTALAAAGLVLSQSPAALAQATQPTSETVTVTGSRLAVTGPYDAPTPLTVLGAEDVKLSGTANIESLLDQTPQFVGATNGGPSSNTQQANGGSGGAYINLRGLGEVRSLVRRFVREITASNGAAIAENKRLDDFYSPVRGSRVPRR